MPPKNRTPQKPAKSDSRLFDSNSSAAGALAQKLGIPVDLAVTWVKAAKDAGCEGFKAGGRVHEDGLMRWIEANRQSLPMEAIPKLEAVKLQKALEDLRKVRIANDKAESRLVDAAKVVAFLVEFAKRQDAVLAQRLENEYPVAVAGLQPPEARILGKRIRDEICKDTQGAVADLRRTFDL